MIIYYNRNKTVKELQNCLDTIFKKCAFLRAESGFNKIKILKSAALNSDKKIRDIDYIIENDKIVIIDNSTGLKMPKTSWNNFLHEMVEIKESLEPKRYGISYASVTHHDFFNLYKTILGVTGTIGTDRDRKDLKEIYNVDIFKCPRHFIREKEINIIQRHKGLDSIFKLISEDIMKEYKKGRPILVIMDNIRNVDDFVSQFYFKNISTIKGID